MKLDIFNTPKNKLLRKKHKATQVSEDEMLNEHEELEKRYMEARFVLRMMVESLPTNRDWLDPVIESSAKDVLDGK